MDNVYGINLIPENDSERVAALERYQIFNTRREIAFDSICELACELFGCPMSHISFLGADTEFIKADVGLNGIESVSRGVGFCAVAILYPEIMLVEDTLESPMFANHPYVTGELKIRFYAAAPVITPDGYIIGTMCLIDTKPRTITQQEQGLLKKLAKVVMEQTELRYNNISLVQQRDEFIATASHEMRTPLTSLQASLQLLQYKSNADMSLVEQRLIEQANRSVTKISRLVNELFDASRMAERKFTLERTAFKLADVIGHASDFMAVTGKYSIEVIGDADIIVTADERKIEQVLVNIFDNAIKYAPDSHVISLKIEQIPGFIKISVIDDGPGITQQDLPHLFRRFFRSEPNFTKTGLGLGLYICAEIVKEHGGHIGVESEAGKGTTFWFTLPVEVTLE